MEHRPTTGVVVTGGASGIGYGSASALAEAGTAEQKAAVLPGLLTGETVAAWCGPTPRT